MKNWMRKMIGAAAAVLMICMLAPATAMAAPEKEGRNAAAGEIVDGHSIAPVAAAMAAKQLSNVRSGPAVTYPVIGKLENGQVVNVCGQTDTGWYQVVYGNSIGYVSGRLLVQVPAEEAVLAQLAQQAVYVKQTQAAVSAQAAAQTQQGTWAPQVQQAAPVQQAVPGSGNVIFVGDSRTGQMGNAVGGTAAYPGVAFVSCYGGGNEWLSTPKAKTDIDQFVTPGSIIVINYGVNDLANHNAYIETINRYAQDWFGKGAAVYFATVGPVGENQYGKRNWAVEYFNDQLSNRLNGNIGRIPLYQYLVAGGYTTQADGLHYTADTYARMFQYLMSSIGKM